MYKRQPAQPEVMRLVFESITKSGPLSIEQLCAYHRSISNCAIYDALQQLRDDGILACTGHRWWKRLGH